jgi:hypothetical protein
MHLLQRWLLGRAATAQASWAVRQRLGRAQQRWPVGPSAAKQAGLAMRLSLFHLHVFIFFLLFSQQF